MDLQQEWQNLNAEMIDKDLTQTASIQLDAKSHSLMQDLMFKLKWKLRWIRILDLPILAGALFFRGDFQILLLAIFITYEVFLAFGAMEFNKIKTGVDYSSSTKQVLEANLKAVRRILRLENIFGHIFIPLSGPTGLLAYLLYKYQSFEQVLQRPNFLLQMGIMVLIGIPLIYIGRKMNNSIFSAPIKDLSKKIEELS